MRRPMKPHVDGYEDEEDCEGHYDPDEDDRRGCGMTLLKQRGADTNCRRCKDKWLAEEDARVKVEWDAKTPEEKARHEAMIKGLRELY